jgi:hypothetical protein
MTGITRSRGSAAAKQGAFARALERMREKRMEREREVRIGLIVDATGSREASWEQAQVAQARVFDALARLHKASLRLVHYGGGEIIAHGYAEDATELAARMAAVRCHQGLTQILPALRVMQFDDVRPEVIIVVGDAFEEDADELAHTLPFIKDMGIRIYALFEGENLAAERAFRLMAEKTGGRFARLGEDMPLTDLCEGIALLVGGGARAVKRIGNKSVRTLLLSGPETRR